MYTRINSPVDPPRIDVAIFHPALTEASFTPKKPFVEDATIEFIDVSAAPPTRSVESAAAVMMNFVAVMFY